MIDILKISLIAFMFCALGQDEGMIFNWYQKLIKDLPIWIRFPIGGCYKCFSGQVCFWYYLILHFNSYNIVEHLFYPSAGILSAMAYNKIYCYLK
jgi:hypothetical protein